MASSPTSSRAHPQPVSPERDSALSIGYGHFSSQRPSGRLKPAHGRGGCCVIAPFDFGVLPPEVNSGRMYSGAGAGPMLAAAAAWNGLAAELRVTALGYTSVLSELTSQSWHGPASVSMAAAAAPYLTWLSTTAVQAEETAAQAEAAVAAYEAAFAATVPPPSVAANRAQLMALIATNFFGQNTPA